MVKAEKITNKEGESWYEMTLVHPITNETVMQGDGFSTLEEVATFASDLASAVFGSYVPMEDVLSQIEVGSERTLQREPPATEEG